jgi:hypothetical protein
MPRPDRLPGTGAAAALQLRRDLLHDVRPDPACRDTSPGNRRSRGCVHGVERPGSPGPCLAAAQAPPPPLSPFRAMLRYPSRRVPGGAPAPAPRREGAITSRLSTRGAVRRWRQAARSSLRDDSHAAIMVKRTERHQRRHPRPASGSLSASGPCGRRRDGLERGLDGVGDELRGLRVDGDVAAEQHAADDVADVPGRVLRAVGHVSPPC